jgi:hypothetical protein
VLATDLIYLVILSPVFLVRRHHSADRAWLAPPPGASGR